MDRDGSPYTVPGTYLLDNVISKHSNVRLLLCGHHRGVRRWSQTYEDGRTFEAVMYNLQAENKSLGYFMLLTFDPLERTISFTSYSPYYDDYNYYQKNEIETFTIEKAY